MSTWTPLVDAISQDLQRIVRDAAEAFAAPISVVTLVHDHVVSVKAGIGLDLACSARGDSFCTHAVDRALPLEICDALDDPVFRRLPVVVDPPHARYYIGAPLRLADGPDIGVLCVLDTVARPPASRDQRAYLTSLARRATDALEHRAHMTAGAAA